MIHSLSRFATAKKSKNPEKKLLQINEIILYKTFFNTSRYCSFISSYSCKVIFFFALSLVSFIFHKCSISLFKFYIHTDTYNHFIVYMCESLNGWIDSQHFVYKSNNNIIKSSIKCNINCIHEHQHRHTYVDLKKEYLNPYINMLMYV